MSIEDVNVIDSVVDAKKSEDSVLIISDHLDWTDEENHLLLLRDKVNTYISYIESGQFNEEFPESKDKQLVFMVIGKHKLPEIGEKFINQLNTVLNEELNIEVRFSHLSQE